MKVIILIYFFAIPWLNDASYSYPNTSLLSRSYDKNKCYPLSSIYNDPSCGWKLCVIPVRTCPGNQFYNHNNCECQCPPQMQEPLDYDKAKKVWDPTNCALKCITELPPKNGYKWSSEICDYVCAKTDAECNFPHVVNKTCQCACRFNPPRGYNKAIKFWDEKECELRCFKDLSNITKEGFEWSHYYCDYICISPQVFNEAGQCECPSYMKEPSEYDKSKLFWDSKECKLKCINDLSEVEKDGFQWDSKVCEYVCISPQVSDQNGECECPLDMREPANYDKKMKFWSPQECRLKCFNIVSDLGLNITEDDCRYSRYVNEKCQCVCNKPEPAEYNRTIERWNTQNCFLQCYKFVYGTPTIGYKLVDYCNLPHSSTHLCECVCPTREPIDYDRTIKRWSYDVCKFVCLKSDADCVLPQKLNNKTCLCECPSNIQKPYFFNRDIKKWNDQKCQLECINPKPAVVPQGKVWNEDNCALDCDIKCELPKGKSPTACECICLPTLPIEKCSGAQVYNSSAQICRCVCPENKQKPAEFDKNKFQWDSRSCRLVSFDPSRPRPPDCYPQDDNFIDVDIKKFDWTYC